MKSSHFISYPQEAAALWLMLLLLLQTKMKSCSFTSYLKEAATLPLMLLLLQTRMKSCSFTSYLQKAAALPLMMLLLLLLHTRMKSCCFTSFLQKVTALPLMLLLHARIWRAAVLTLPARSSRFSWCSCHLRGWRAAVSPPTCRKPLNHLMRLPPAKMKRCSFISYL